MVGFRESKKRGGEEEERLNEKKRRVWQKSREKEQRQKKRGRERPIGRRADCRVSSCKINGGMLSVFSPAFTAVVMETGQNLLDCF